VAQRALDVTDPWANRDYLHGTQYKTDKNLAARQSIYAYQHPRVDLAARVLDLAAPALSGTVVDVGCGNGMYPAAAAFPRNPDGYYAITSHSGCLVCEVG
jgi:16S rRNA G1207 methylase RsmC